MKRPFFCLRYYKVIRFCCQTKYCINMPYAQQIFHILTKSRIEFYAVQKVISGICAPEITAIIIETAYSSQVRLLII